MLNIRVDIDKDRAASKGLIEIDGEQIARVDETEVYRTGVDRYIVVRWANEETCKIIPVAGAELPAVLRDLGGTTAIEQLQRSGHLPPDSAQVPAVRKSKRGRRAAKP